MAVKTINLTGLETAVTGLDGSHAAIRNDGAGTIYAAKQPGITPGADGVLSIPAGGAAVLRGISGTVYLTGTGSVMMITSDYGDNPFKSAAQSGSGADEVARAAINAHEGSTEIHVTVDEKTSWDGKTTLAEAAQVFSNPNLLINPDFRINQRGKDIYTGAGVHTVDRWRLHIGAESYYNVQTKTITIPPNSLYGGMMQTLEDGDLLSGKTVTLSVDIATDCDIMTRLVWRVNDELYSHDSTISAGFFGKNSCTVNLPENISVLEVQITNAEIIYSRECHIMIDSAKLEIGGIATPFCPPDPATELAKCQRYYQKIIVPMNGFIPAAQYGGDLSKAVFSMNMPEKRTNTYSVTASAGGRVVLGSGIYQAAGYGFFGKSTDRFGVEITLDKATPSACSGWIDTFTLEIDAEL